MMVTVTQIARIQIVQLLAVEHAQTLYVIQEPMNGNVVQTRAIAQAIVMSVLAQGMTSIAKLLQRSVLETVLPV